MYLRAHHYLRCADWSIMYHWLETRKVAIYTEAETGPGVYENSLHPAIRLVNVLAERDRDLLLSVTCPDWSGCYFFEECGWSDASRWGSLELTASYGVESVRLDDGPVRSDWLGFFEFLQAAVKRSDCRKNLQAVEVDNHESCMGQGTRTVTYELWVTPRRQRVFKAGTIEPCMHEGHVGFDSEGVPEWEECPVDCADRLYGEGTPMVVELRPNRPICVALVEVDTWTQSDGSLSESVESIGAYGSSGIAHTTDGHDDDPSIRPWEFGDVTQTSTLWLYAPKADALRLPPHVDLDLAWAAFDLPHCGR